MRVDPVGMTIPYREIVKTCGEIKPLHRSQPQFQIEKLSESFKIMFNFKSTLGDAIYYMSKISQWVIDYMKDVQHFPEYTFPYVIDFEVACDSPLGFQKVKIRIGIF